tara:strand:- start:183 stop:356 length:174 start_codon:yes stop_codon:yes gene_type:complete
MSKSNNWYIWMQEQTLSNRESIKNLEESLLSYRKIQKRMLYALGLVVIVNGLLLFFK